jgi:hypothetical protein
MSKDSFVFYRSFYEAISELDDQYKLEIFNAICEIGLNQNELELKGVSKAIFTLIKPQIVANNTKYENGRKGADFGGLGGRPKKKNNPEITPKKPQENPTQTPNVNENVNVNVNDIKEKNIKKEKTEIEEIEIVKNKNLDDFSDLKQPLPHIGTIPPEISFKFQEFWSVYPKKIAREQALRAFNLAVNEGVKPDELIKSAKFYAESVSGDEEKYKINPDKWLRQKRWTDEICQEEVVEYVTEKSRNLSKWRARIGSWKKGLWLSEWGPEPDKADRDKQIPIELLIEMGIITNREQKHHG